MRSCAQQREKATAIQLFQNLFPEIRCDKTQRSRRCLGTLHPIPAPNLLLDIKKRPDGQLATNPQQLISQNYRTVLHSFLQHQEINQRFSKERVSKRNICGYLSTVKYRLSFKSYAQSSLSPSPRQPDVCFETNGV
ncbi:hypothetical protein CEXT_149921 [Caerostris extrusa]|uniref:Uncharacterized protein n=1 Tax=Caerostris extrusa TaxID=172846 RepID=A0AAV4NDJ2_CAEEX|nr:hypothetical protein CEXT_149921 [Caerostris extrusa]